MSNNQPPPGPYGQQPQNPYGQQQPPQNPYAQPQGGGYGYPQQGQQPPAPPAYGQPQQGYGYPQQGQQPPAYGQPQQGGYPGQGGYGYQQPPMGPQGGGNGKRVGIIVGAVVALAAIGVGVFFVTKGSDDKDNNAKNGDTKQSSTAGSSSTGGSGGDKGDSGKKYKLITPNTVATDYTKSTDSDLTGDDEGFDSSDLTELKALGVENPTKVSAAYTKGDTNSLSGALLMFSGVYGTVKDPNAVLDGMFGHMKDEASKPQDDGSTIALDGEPKKVHPAGLEDGAVMECQNAKYTEDGTPITVPICLWADSSTVGYVLPVDIASAALGGDTSIDSSAELAAKVRTDVRVPLN